MASGNCFSAGGGGVTSEQKTSSTTETKTPEQKQALADTLNLYMKQLGINNVYEGERVAPFTDFQNTILSGAKDMGSQFLDTYGNIQPTTTPLFAETGKAIGDILSGTTGATKTTPDQVNTYFKEKIQDPAMRMLNKDLLPTVDEGYTGGNFFSTARGKARDKMTEDVGNQLIQQKSQLEWDTNQANQALDEAKASRILQAIPQSMAYGQMPAQETLNNLQIAAGKISGLNALLGIGSAEQTQEQQQITAAMGRFMEANQITDPTDMAIIMGLLGLNYTSSSSSSQGADYGAGIGYVGATNAAASFGQAAGTGAAAALI